MHGPQRDERHERRDAEQQTLTAVPPDEVVPSRRERDERQGAHVREDEEKPVLVAQGDGHERFLLAFLLLPLFFEFHRRPF